MNNVEPGMFRRALNVIGIALLVILFAGCGVHTVMDGLKADDVQSAPEQIFTTGAEVESEIEEVEEESSELVQMESAPTEDVIVLAIKSETKIRVEEGLNIIANPTHSNDAIMLARLVRGEAGGIWSLTEQACVMWTVLNRIDAGYGDTVAEVITAPDQYYYIESFGTNDEYGRDLVWLAEDVISRWEREKAGEINVGRVLPAEYLFFGGDGYHNYFRTTYEFGNGFWDYSLPSPYEN